MTDLSSYNIGDVLETRLLQYTPTKTVLQWELVVEHDTHNDILFTTWKPAERRRDNGKLIRRPIWMPLPGSQHRFLNCPIYEALIHGNRGPGKRVLLTEKVLTDRGWVAAGEVKYSDRLVSVDGTYTEILGIYRHDDRPLNLVTFDDDASITVDDEHLWKVYDNKNMKWSVKTTADLAARLERNKVLKGPTNWSIPTCEAVPGKSWEGYDPYIIGLLIGDGTMSGNNPTIYNPEEPIRDYLTKAGWACYNYEYRAVYQFQLLGAGAHELVGAPKATGDQKYVPEALKMADPVTRLAILQGLMDSDGHCDKDGRVEFKSVSEQLAKDVQYLARSLGGKAAVHCQKVDPESGYGSRDRIYRVKITHAGKFTPFRLQRHIDRMKKDQQGKNRRIMLIEPIGNGPGVCFEVAHPSHLFVCQDFIVTHNTAGLIMDYAKDVGRGFGHAWRGVIFRMEYKGLDDVVKKAEDLFPKMWPQKGTYRFLKSKSEYMCTWKTGEALLFRILEDESGYDAFHGHELPWQGFEELTLWPNDKAYMKMRACSRSTTAGIRPRVRATTNPYGPGMMWVKRRFNLGDESSYGTVIRNQDEDPRVAIQSLLHENFLLMHAEPEYPRRIAQAARNPAEAAAWVTGSWNVSSGGLFDDLWDSRYHVVPTPHPRMIPDGWEWIVRSYDHGQSHPFAVLWTLESNGEPITVHGRKLGEVRGDIIVWKVWYGSNGQINEGLRMPSNQIAQGIMRREAFLGIQPRVLPGPADTQIFNKLADRNNRSVADDFRAEGVDWERADKSPGSRVRGNTLIRNMLADAMPKEGIRERKGLFFCDRLQVLPDDRPFDISLFSATPRDPKNPDDSPENYEDHFCDALRYRITWERPTVYFSSF